MPASQNILRGGGVSRIICVAVFAVLVVASADFAHAQSFSGGNVRFTGAGGSTVNVNVQVTPSDTRATFAEISPFPVSDYRNAGGTVSLINQSNPITLAFTPSPVTETTVFEDVSVDLYFVTSGGATTVFVVPYTITVHPVPSFTSITATGTGGTTIDHTLEISGIPSGYTFVSIAPDSDLADESVTASGTTATGDNLTVSFGLPHVLENTEITGNITVRYSVDDDNPEFTVPVTLTVTPPTPPTFTSINATGTGGTTLDHALSVSELPPGYTFVSIEPDSGLTDELVTASGTTAVDDNLTVSFGLPHVLENTEITGNITVQYSAGDVNPEFTVPVTLTVTPPNPPTFTSITATGTGGTTLDHALSVSGVPSGYTFVSIEPDSGLTDESITASGTTAVGDNLTVSFTLPHVISSTTLSGNITVRYSAGDVNPEFTVPVTITVTPPPAPSFTSITATGTGGTTINHALSVSGVPSGYTFVSIAPDSDLTDESVTASGTTATEDNLTVSFTLPHVIENTEITGNITVRYSAGDVNPEFTVPVTLTITPPPAPSFTSITATGTGGTTINHALSVSGVPSGYTFVSIEPDSGLTDESVTASGTASTGDDLTVSFTLPHVIENTEITGNITVQYSAGDVNPEFTVPVTLTVTPPTPPSFTSITATGTGGTTLDHALSVSGVPSGYTFVSIEPDSGLTDESITASGTTAVNDNLTVSFTLPHVIENTEITGNITVRYSVGDVNPEFTVPATITVTPPTPPTFTSITATGTGGTTLDHALSVSELPPGYTFVSIEPDSGLTDELVTASGTTAVDDNLTVSFGLPHVLENTEITGNITVQYSAGDVNPEFTVPVTLTVTPPNPPTFTSITATGTGGTTLDHALSVSGVPSGYTFVSIEPDSGLTDESITASGTTAVGDNLTVSFTLPHVISSTTLSGNITVRYSAGDVNPEFTVPVTITVTPPPAPSFTSITATGTGGTTINHALSVSGVPSGYTFVSIAPDSDLTDESVTASGTTATEDNLTVSFTLPHVIENTEITGNITVRYSAGDVNPEFTVPVTLTITPPPAPSFTSITATGTGGTTINHALSVSGVPSGYTFVSIEPDSGLTDESVTASGTASTGDDLTVSFTLPHVIENTEITGNITVQYSAGDVNPEFTVPVTLTVTPPTPPSFTSITATGTGGTTLDHALSVSGVPSGYTFVSIEPDSGLTDESITASGTTAVNDNLTVSFTLPHVIENTEITGNITVQYSVGDVNPEFTVPVTITVTPPTPPSFTSITATGTGGTTINHTLEVSGVPSGYAFVSIEPDSGLTDESVIASGTTATEDNLTASFTLPHVVSSTTITGNITVRYSAGDVNPEFTVPVTITVTPPTPPSFTSITATGTGGTTINHTLEVSGVPSGYAFVSIEPDSGLTDESVIASGTTAAGDNLTVSFTLPHVIENTEISGNITVQYSVGDVNPEFTVPVTLTITPPTPPTFTPITASGTGGTIINHTLLVSGVPSGYAFVSIEPDSGLTDESVIASGTTATGDNLTASFTLPHVIENIEITGNITVRYSAGDVNPEFTVPVTLTITPPTAPTFTPITATGTGGTTIDHTLLVSGIPSGYTFVSIAPDSDLTDESITASGTTSTGDNLAVSFGLPHVVSSTTITGNITVRYSAGDVNPEFTVPVTITVTPPTPPTFTSITATGTGGTTINHTLEVSGVPSGYTFVSIAPDSDLTDESITASGTTAAGDNLTVSFTLPHVVSSTTITGNITVQYSVGDVNPEFTVPTTITITPPTPPSFTSITASGTGGTTIDHTLLVSGVPSGYTFVSIEPDSDLTDESVTASGIASTGDNLTVSFGLPHVLENIEISGNITVQYSAGDVNPEFTVPVTITVTPPTPPTFTPITATGTGGTIINHTLLVSGVPSGYIFVNIEPDSGLTDESVTASGTTATGDNLTASFTLPHVIENTEITGNITVQYSADDVNPEFTVPVTITVTPPTAPTFTPITATGTGGTTIDHTLLVSGIPSGYTFVNIEPDSGLTDESVTASGTTSTEDNLTVSFGLPHVVSSTIITGNITVQYSAGDVNPEFTVPVTIIVTPPTPPTFTPITATGTGGTTINHALSVSGVPSGYTFVNIEPDSGLTDESVTASGTTAAGDNLTVSFGLPHVIENTEITGNITVRYSAGDVNPEFIVPVTLTVTPPTAPTFTPITASGTGGTTINHTLLVSGIPSGYTFVSIEPDSGLTDESVTASGTTAAGDNLTVSFTLPHVVSSTTILGNITVQYSAGDVNPEFIVPVTLTVTPPTAPTFTPITASGTGGTTINHTLLVSGIPSGYTFVSIEPDSDLTDESVTASGTTATGDNLTVSFGLPHVIESTEITGNITVQYSTGDVNPEFTVPVTITITPPTPTFTSITATGTGGTTINHTLEVSGIPSDYTFVSIEPDSGLTDESVTASGTASTGDNLAVSFGLPHVIESTEITGNITVQYSVGDVNPEFTVPVTITITPPTPTFTPITATGTGGTTINHTLEVSGIPSDYTFVSIEPNSDLTDESITASGATAVDDNLTVSFTLPHVIESTEITGNITVRYSAGDVNPEFTVPVTLAVIPEVIPSPMISFPDITIRGTSETTIDHILEISNAPEDFTISSVALAQSDFLSMGGSVHIVSEDPITLQFTLPKVDVATTFTSSVVISFLEDDVTLSRNASLTAIVDPPDVPIQDLTFRPIVLTGFGGESVNHALEVTNIPSDHTFDRAVAAQNLIEESVTAFGAESGGTTVITFVLPHVEEFTVITGDLLVSYIDGDGELQEFTVPATINVELRSDGGGSDDHKKAPTFGVSLETLKQLVTEGFSFNGITLDITDNWHTEFERTSFVIGEVNTAVIKGYASDGFAQVFLSLGVPEVGMVNKAETAIILNLERNSETGLEISEILYKQSEEGLVDETRTITSVQEASCNLLDDNQQCYEFTIEFVVMAPLSHDIMVISAVDEKRRITHTYLNEGIKFVGESLLPASTDQFFQRMVSQDPGRFIELVQQDRRYNVWEDQDGYLWERNSAGTWMRLTYPGIDVTYDDPSIPIKTRMHSDFAMIIQHEQDKARLVFDSTLIQNEMDDSSRYNLPAYMPEHLDLILLENMSLEEILALEKMLNRHIYEDSWD